MIEDIQCERIEIYKRLRNPVTVKNGFLRIDENSVTILTSSKKDICGEYTWNEIVKKELRSPSASKENYFNIYLNNGKDVHLKINYNNQQLNNIEKHVKLINKVLGYSNNTSESVDLETPKNDDNSLLINQMENSFAPNSAPKSTDYSNNEQKSSRNSANNHQNKTKNDSINSSTNHKKLSLLPSNLPVNSKISPKGHNSTPMGVPLKRTNCTPRYSQSTSASSSQSVYMFETTGSENSPKKNFVSLEKQNKDTFEHRRLANTGNSCYFNSIMQALSSCSSVVSRCKHLHRLHQNGLLFIKNREEIIVHQRVMSGFLQMISVLLGSCRPKNKNEFLTEIRKRMGKLYPAFDSNSQQDAHEYLNHLLTSIHEVVIQKTKELADSQYQDNKKLLLDIVSLTSLNPASVFSYKTEKKIVCRSCKREDLRPASEQMAQVAMSNDSMKSEKLYDWLELENKSSLMNRTCSYCSGAVADSVRRFSSFPQCLIINLQRYGRVPFDDLKITKKIEVPFEMDISNFSSFPPIIPNDNEASLKYETLLSARTEEESTEILADKPNVSLKSLKLLGGAKEPDDCHIVDHIRNPFHFKPLSNQQEIQAILSQINVFYEEETLKEHASKLGEFPDMEMKKEDLPGKKISIASDGNCFFRAVSWYLTGKQSNHDILRQKTVKYLEENKKLFGVRYDIEDFDEYIKNMAQDGTWASDREITALCGLLNIQIYTYLNTGWNRIGPDNDWSGSIYLDNRHNLHYEPVISLKNHGILLRQERVLKRNTHESDNDEDDLKQKKISKPNDYPINENSSQTHRRHHLFRSCKRTNKSQNSDCAVYKLVAVVCHYGNSIHIGHYTCYIKDMYRGYWFYSSDEKFERVGEETVSKQISVHGYLLFYERE